MPRVQTTPMVKVALYGLLVYLIVLLSLIMIKFVRTFMAHGTAPPATTTQVTPVPGTTSAQATR